MTPYGHAKELAAALKEFTSDVKAVGPIQVGREWPDLLITYNKATAALARWEKREALVASYGDTTRDPTTGELL